MYKQYTDLWYNAYIVLREVGYSYDDVGEMPIKEVMKLINTLSPKLKELSEARAGKDMEAELSGKQKQPAPSNRKGVLP